MNGEWKSLGVKSAEENGSREKLMRVGGVNGSPTLAGHQDPSRRERKDRA